MKTFIDRKLRNCILFRKHFVLKVDRAKSPSVSQPGVVKTNQRPRSKRKTLYHNTETEQITNWCHSRRMVAPSVRPTALGRDFGASLALAEPLILMIQPEGLQVLSETGTTKIFNHNTIPALTYSICAADEQLDPIGFVVL